MLGVGGPATCPSSKSALFGFLRSQKLNIKAKQQTGDFCFFIYNENIFTASLKPSEAVASRSQWRVTPATM